MRRYGLMNDPNKTQLGAPPVIDPNRTVLGGPGVAVDPSRTVMGGPGMVGTSFEATVTIKPVQCPVCKTFNPVGVKFCVECGLIFEMALEGDAFGAPAVQLPVLVDTNGREYVLRMGGTVVGRQGDIAVEDTRVSRRHAQVTVDASGVWVEDLGSTNGTSVDGAKLGVGEKRAAGNGARLSFGGYEVVVGLPGEANKTLAALGGKTVGMAAPPVAGDTLAWLVFAEREVPLKAGTHSFGRKAENDVQISDPYVSGRHGEIEVSEAGVFLTDTGSTNGTVVNDAKLSVGQKTMIGASDVVKLGQVEIRVRTRRGGSGASSGEGEA